MKRFITKIKSSRGEITFENMLLLFFFAVLAAGPVSDITANLSKKFGEFSVTEISSVSRQTTSTEEKSEVASLNSENECLNSQNIDSSGTVTAQQCRTP